MSKRFALLWCSEEERNDYREEMVNAFKTENSDWEVISAFTDLNKIIDNYDGFVISGSEYSVNADKEKFSGLFEFIRAVHKKEKPIVGICFGCQSLAVALGGEVGLNPSREFRFGTDELTFQNGLNKHVGTSEERVRLIESHGECVIRLPLGSTLLARSDSTAVEIFAVGPYAVGIQGHPEISKKTLEQNFLRLHLEDGNLQEDEVPRFHAELSGYQPPQAIRQLVKATLHKQINFQNLVGDV